MFCDWQWQELDQNDGFESFLIVSITVLGSKNEIISATWYYSLGNANTGASLSVLTSHPIIAVGRRRGHEMNDIVNL